MWPVGSHVLSGSIVPLLGLPFQDASFALRVISQVAAALQHQISCVDKQLISFLWTLLRHNYIEWRRHDQIRTFYEQPKAALGCTKTAPGCTKFLSFYICRSFPAHFFVHFNARSSGNILCSFLDVNSIQLIQQNSNHFCDLCRISFSKASNLAQHRTDKISHKSKQRALNGEDEGTTFYPSHECSICSKVYSSQRSLKHHIREAHETDLFSSARTKKSR